MTNQRRTALQIMLVDRCIDDRDRQVATPIILSAWDVRWYVADRVWDNVGQQLWWSMYRGKR